MAGTKVREKQMQDTGSCGGWCAIDRLSCCISEAGSDSSGLAQAIEIAFLRKRGLPRPSKQAPGYAVIIFQHKQIDPHDDLSGLREFKPTQIYV